MQRDVKQLTCVGFHPLWSTCWSDRRRKPVWTGGHQFQNLRTTWSPCRCPSTPADLYSLWPMYHSLGCFPFLFSAVRRLRFGRGRGEEPGSEEHVAGVGGPASPRRCQYVHPRGGASLMNDSMNEKAAGAWRRPSISRLLHSLLRPRRSQRSLLACARHTRLVLLTFGRLNLLQGRLTPRTCLTQLPFSPLLFAAWLTSDCCRIIQNDLIKAFKNLLKTNHAIWLNIACHE